MADFDISGILNSLSQDDVNNLKKIADGILGNSEPKAKSQSDSLDLSSVKLPDISVLGKLAPVLSAVNTPDERTELISALKPMLSENRRQKADEAIKIVKLLTVLPILHENGIL